MRIIELMDTFPESDKWLNQLPQNIPQEEWLSGIDLYRQSRVDDVSRFEHLICAVVYSIQGKKEVRIKMHPSRKMIQWVECTCDKNRKKGIYCQHIAALLFHIHQERDELSPSSACSLPNFQSTDAHESTESLLEGLFKQGRSQITAIKHSESTLKILFELKKGKTSELQLPIDKHPSFLSSLAEIERRLLPPLYKTMNISDDTAQMGLYFYLDSSEQLHAKKVYSLRRGPSKKLAFDGKHFHEKVSICTEQAQEDAWIFAIPETSLSPWVGEEYMALPGVAYYKISNSYEQWKETPQKISFTDAQAAQLFQNSFKSFRKQGPIFLNKSLTKIDLVNNLTLSEVKVLDEKNGWFYLDPQYVSDEKSIGMYDLISKASKSKSSFIKTEKMWVQIPQILLQNKWAVDTKTKSLKVNNLDLIKFKQSLTDSKALVGKKELLERIQNSTEFQSNSELPSLSHTKLDLREYQKEGYRWLWWLYQNNLHGLLADDMGLGKTHQTMAIMSAIQKSVEAKDSKQKAMFLCICPTTVLDHWLDKIKKFAPELKPLKYYGSKRESLIQEFSNHNTIITTYGILLRDFSILEKVSWESIVLDEAHFVKNNKTATYRAACKLDANLRLCLSGTPMENRLSELKNIFDFIVPGYLGSDKEFQKSFLIPIESKKREDKELELKKLISPLKMRRTKDQVLLDLPEKIEDTRYNTLSNEQVSLYKSILASQAAPIVQNLKEGKSSPSYMHVFTVLQKLKQVCNHPALLKESKNWRDGESGKFELFRNLLSEALESNHKVVIYSQYLQMIDIFKSYLKEMGIGHVVLTGKTQKRGEVIENFQTDPNIKVFVGSLLAGGLGIDLTAASVVIHYDRWWNASKENQATDRVHRIGQKNFTQVFKLVSRGTLEEKIDRMIAEKGDLFNRFLESDQEAFKKLSKEDLINLLQ